MSANSPVWHPSPNFGDRRDGLTPKMVVLHYTAMASSVAALERLCDPTYEVSAHYLIGRDGTVWHMVDEAKRAWHAGAGQWNGQRDINSRSIGIELTNTGDEPFGDLQMSALEVLISGIIQRWAIQPVDVIGHSDMAPNRKIDPGPRFDWARLAFRGLAIGPLSVAERGAEPSLEDSLTEIGYPAESEATSKLAAFRARFCPWRHGPATQTDRDLAAAVANRFRIDRGLAQA